MTPPGNPPRFYRPRTVLAVLAAGLACRVITALAFPWPGIMDPAYYQDVALHLHAGEGLTTRILWNFHQLPEDMVHPACAYWGPGVPALLAGAFWVTGASLVAGQALMILLSLVLIHQTLALAWRLGLDEDLAAAGGLLIAGGLQLNYFGVTLDTPTPFAVFANGGLIALALAVTVRPAYLFLATPFGVLAMLTRADGMLLPLLTLGFTLGLTLARRARPSTAVLVLGLHILFLAPWYRRNVEAFGTASPTSLVDSITMSDYSDLFRIRSRPGPRAYFERGAGKILAEKWDALTDNLSTLALGEYAPLVWLFPLALPRLIATPLAWPYLVHFAGLLLAMTLVFNFQSRNGSLLHSFPALIPFVFLASLDALRRLLEPAGDAAPTRITRRRRLLARLAPWLMVIYFGMHWAGSLTGLAGLARDLENARLVLRDWAEGPSGAGGGTRYMSNDSLDFALFLPDPVVQEPRDPGLEPVFEIARRYSVSYLVIFDGPSVRYRDWSRDVHATEAGDRLVHVTDIATPVPGLGLRTTRIFRFELAPDSGLEPGEVSPTGS